MVKVGNSPVPCWGYLTKLTGQQEVIEQLTELRGIMRRNYDNGNVDKVPQQRWCSGDSPWLFKERWEKIFEDWVGIKQEKFDPSRVSSACWLTGIALNYFEVSELYDSVGDSPYRSYWY